MADSTVPLMMMTAHRPADGEGYCGGSVQVRGPPLSAVPTAMEPMVWVYAPDVYQFMPNYNWDKLAEVFDTAWTASAFKGAHGPTLTVPPMEKHITNTLAWLNVMKNEASKFTKGNIAPIIL